MGLLGKFGRREPETTTTAPMKQSLPPAPQASDEYQRRIRAQMEQELEQQRARLQPRPE